jgi:hypothetical protein
MDRKDVRVHETHQVCLAEPDDEFENTLALCGYDVVLPLELDVDGDPLHDDVARLSAEVGRFQREVASSDPDDAEVDEQARVVFYTFRDVPPGIYRLEARIHDGWHEIVRGIVVRKEGVFVAKTKLDEARPEVRFTGVEDEPAEVVEQAGEDMIDWLDVADEGRR